MGFGLELFLTRRAMARSVEGFIEYNSERECLLLSILLLV